MLHRLIITMSLFCLIVNKSFGVDSSSSRKQSLDSVVRDSASNALLRRRTGILYDVSLPSNLSGMEAYALRERSSYFWHSGANIVSVQIPPHTTSVPFVRRLVFVYQHLGKLSADYYNVAGYSLVAPVIGLLAYDASSDLVLNKEVRLRTAGDPINIVFPDLVSSEDAKCAWFGSGGAVHLSNMSGSNVCSFRNTGHFTVVVPSMSIPVPPPPLPDKTEGRWRVYLIASAGAFVAVVLVCLLGVGVLKLARNRKMEALERHAERGEALDSIWVGTSKMPSASMTRTSPMIENIG